MDRLLATLVTHRKDPMLRTAYRQFKTFAYQAMMKETDKKTGCWPGILMRKDLDLMIKLRFRKEVEKRYGQEIQSLCRTPSFGLATKSKSWPGEIDQRPLENIIGEAQKNAPLLSSMIMTVGPCSRRASSISSMPNAATT